MVLVLSIEQDYVGCSYIEHILSLHSLHKTVCILRSRNSTAGNSSIYFNPIKNEVESTLKRTPEK